MSRRSAATVGPAVPTLTAVANPSSSSAPDATAAADAADYPDIPALKGKIAIVTGATSGIGRACAFALHRAGMRVTGVGRRYDLLVELEEELWQDEQRRAKAAAKAAGAGGRPRAGGGDDDPTKPHRRFYYRQTDLADEEEVKYLFVKNRNWWGQHTGAGCDVLVHAAGLARGDASIFTGSTESWREMAEVNLIATAVLFREAVKDMEQRGQWGTIVSVTGLTSHRCPDAQSGGSFFAGTKMAMRMVTEGLRREARERGVPLRVCAVSPGLVDTNFFAERARGLEAPEAARARAMVSLGQGGLPLAPEDVARCVLFCLSAPEHVDVNDVIVRPRAQAI